MYLMMNFNETYQKTLIALGLEAYAGIEFAEKFELLCHRLIEVNQQMNLTAITLPEEIILRHFADSLTAAPLMGSQTDLSVIDVGCGGGFPVLPLAIVRSDCTYTALDSTAKKLTFVARMADELHLPVQICAARAEEAARNQASASGHPYTAALSHDAGAPLLREAFDLCVSRAVARMPVLIELTLPFVKIGGRFIALKGAEGELECTEAENAISKLGGTVKSIHRLTLSSAGERVLLEIEKKVPSPAAYPRTYGQIKKKPL